MKKLNYEKTFYSISIVMIIIWAFALVSLLFGFDTPQYSRSKTISENEEYLYQWTNKLKNGTAFNNLCFSDGTCMTSAGVGSISVYTNPNYLTGSGILSSPLSVNSDNVTIQGNTFNSANKLLQLDGTGLIPSYLIPTLNYLLKTGDTMSGHLNMGGNNVLNVSTISINGNGYTNYIYGNASQNDNITYILPYSTDIAEGSYLTYGSNGQLSWQQPAIAGEDNLGNHIATTSLNMSGYDINNANYINAVKYYGDGSELTNISGDNLGNHIATMTLTTDYGINTSTIQTKNILVYDAQPYINILSLNYLNSPEIRFSTIATNSSWSIGNVNTWYDALVFKQKGINEKMILTQDGKLSIGTNPTPNEKLEVSGNIKADTFINTISGTTNYIVVSTALYSMNGGGGGDSGGYTSFVIDDFSSYANGSQTQFTLSQSPIDNSLQVSKNGLVLKSTDDYSLAGQVITFVTAPASGSKILAQYAVGISTTEKQLVASTNSWSGINTFNNNTIYNSSISINANTSQQYSLTIDSNTNSSDGYIVSITTSGGITSVYSDIGYKVIVSSELSNRQNSIILTGFNMKMGQKCRLYFSIGNPSGDKSYILIYINDDNNAHNYWTQEGAFFGGSYSALRNNAPTLGYAGNGFNAEGYCDISWAKRTNYYTWFCNSRRDDTDNLQNLLYVGTTNSVKTSPISKIEIRLANDGNFETNSYAELMCIGDWR